jgi:adenosylcobinamide kinase/adenosylcobinamide-phosphate guanylyltransferase
MLPNLTLVLGGANSGKSDFAETLVRKTGLRRIYIATAQAFDTEMQAKIDTHRIARGDTWLTIEAPLDLAAMLKNRAADEATLIDCATLWLSNHLLADHDLEAQSAALLAALANTPGPVVVVSNEVGMGIVPDNALARQFRTAQGRLNRALAAQAGLAVAVMAGLPLVLKGTLPEDGA